MAAALQKDHAPRRAYSRLRLGIPARLLTLEGQKAVTLVDLSQSGARILLDGPSRVNGGGMLRWLGYEAFGDVAWQFGEDLALQFDQSVDLSWLVETRQRAPVELDRDRHIRRAAREFVTGRPGLRI
jgi:hypothetical protein